MYRLVGSLASLALALLFPLTVYSQQPSRQYQAQQQARQQAQQRAQQQARQQAQQQARAQAQQQARLQAQQQARLQAQQQARLQAQQQARLQAQQQARLQAQQQARLQAQQQARLQAQQQARLQAQQQAQQQARLQAQQQAKSQAQQQARLQAQQQARLQAQEQAKSQAQQQARLQAQQQTRLQAQQQARLQAQEQAKSQAQQQARLQAQQQAKLQAQPEAKSQAQQQARSQAQQQARLQAQQQARLQALQQAKLQPQQQARLQAPSQEAGRGIMETDAKEKRRAAIQNATQLRQSTLLQQARNTMSNQGQLSPDFNKLWNDILNRPFVDVGTAPAVDSYDVVFQYSWGGTSHHKFATLAEAQKFADEYRHGVYSTQDGTLARVDVVPLKNTDGGFTAAPTGGGSTPRLAFDESISKGPSAAAIREKVGQLVADDRLKQTLANQEGVKLTPYLDPVNKLTTGIGFNLEAKGAADKLAKVGLDYAKVVAGVQTPTPQQMVQLLDMGINAARQMAANKAIFTGDNLNLPLVPNYNKLSQVQKDAVVNLLFNMGAGGKDADGVMRGFAGFRGLRQALNQQDFDKAAIEMIDSKWYDQVGKRAPAVVKDLTGMDSTTQDRIYNVLVDRDNGDKTSQQAQKEIHDILKGIPGLNQTLPAGSQGPGLTPPPPPTPGLIPLTGNDK